MKIRLVLLISTLGATMAVNTNETSSAVTTTVKPRRNIEKVIYRATDTREECSMKVITFTNSYLRGVKSPNLISYNNTNFQTCQRICCYEESFNCRSFSFFKPLRQCFIMNLTRHNRKVDLITTAVGYIHVQVISNDLEMTTMMMETTDIPVVEITTSLTTAARTTDAGKETTTSSKIDGTTEGWVIPTTSADSEFSGDSDSIGVDSGAEKLPGEDGESNNGKDLGSGEGIFETPLGPEKLTAERCSSVNCGENGVCRLTNGTDEEREPYCDCKKGFTGVSCETESSEEGGLIWWIILIIVLGSLIMIFIIAACVLLILYKHKKGEYRVVDYIRTWAKRDKKPKKPDNDNEIAHMEDDPHGTSPTASVHSIPNDAAKTAV